MDWRETWSEWFVAYVLGVGICALAMRIVVEVLPSLNCSW